MNSIYAACRTEGKGRCISNGVGGEGVSTLSQAQESIATTLAPYIPSNLLSIKTEKRA